MTTIDLRVLCTALGFMAVAMKDGVLNQQNGRRARMIAGLMEEFCREAMPEAFEDEDGFVTGVRCETVGKSFKPYERMASMIVEITKAQGGCLPQDLIARGFAGDEVERYWAMAKALAAVELNILDS